MADEVSIDKNSFHTRLSALLSAWKADKRSGGNVFGDAGSIAIAMGKTDEAAGFHKANALQFWLLGYEFPATLFVLTLEGMYIITTKKKAVYLEVLKDGKTPVEILVRGKDTAENQKQFERCLEIIRGAGKKVGVIMKDMSGGPFVDEWKSAFSEISKEVEEVDISPALSAAMIVKDEAELRAIRNASHATSHITNYFKEQMLSIVDEEKKITHKDLSDRIANKIDDDKFFRQMKAADFDPAQLDWSVSPTVMSGGNFDLKLQTDPDSNNLHAGVIISALGLRYQTYASMIARTYLVDPNKSQESTYKLLLNVHETVMKELKDGVPAKNAYTKAVTMIKAKKPELLEKFVKNVGAGIGIEARDSSMVLNGKNGRVLKDGMTLCVTTGFYDIENPDPSDKKKDAKYSMMLSDTIRINGPAVGTGEPFSFTKRAPADMESMSFFFGDDEEEQKKPAKPKKDSRVGAVAQSNIQKTRLRGQGGQTANEEKENLRRGHQKELHQKKQREGKEKYADDVGLTR